MPKSSEYWKQRFDQVEQSANNRSVKYTKQLEKKYQTAAQQLDKQINAWYQRIANNNEVTITEARKLLSDAELKEFKWAVEDYIKYGKQNAVDQSWMKELENASAKFHINRLEAMKLEARQQVEQLFAGGQEAMYDTLADVYKDTFYRSCFEIQKGVGVGFDVSKLDDKQVSTLLKKPWSVDGTNFSTKLWGNKRKLINTLDQELSRMVLTGESPKNAIANIRKAMDTSQYAAKRLVLTEQAYFTTVAQKNAYGELDVEEYEIVATLDNRTSDICQKMDGQHFPLKDMQPGVNAPPFHVFCRTTTCPYFDDEFTVDDKRIAKDEEGNYYEVPANMTYPEWKKSFVDGGSKEDLTPVVDSDIVKMTTKKFTDASEAKAYFGERPETSLRRTNREEYDRQREQFKNSSFGKWYDSLEIDESVCIANYSGDDYHAINGLLRQEMTENQVKLWDKNSNKTTIENIDNITNAISRFDLSDNITVYRTCEEDVFLNLKKNIGGVFQDDGFTSTSVLNVPVASGNVMMEIDVPSGTGVGAWISPLSGTEEEYEFLLQRGTKFRIDDIVEDGNETKIHMTVVGSEQKEEFSYATKEEVIELWKKKGVYDEDAVKSL